MGGSAAAAAAAREGRWGRKAASQNHAWCRNSRLLILNCEARPAGRWAWAWAWAAVGDNCPRWHCGVRWEHGQSHLADTTPRRQCAIWTPACTVQTVSARRLSPSLAPGSGSSYRRAASDELADMHPPRVCELCSHPAGVPGIVQSRVQPWRGHTALSCICHRARWGERRAQWQR